MSDPTFGSLRVAGEYPQLGEKCPALLVVLQDAEAFADLFLGWRLEYVSIYRTDAEDKALGGTGVHCTWRAADVRTHARPPRWDDPATQALADHVNGLWAYDPERPRLKVALYEPHESATGPHVHFQVHNHTIRRVPEGRTEA